MTAAQEVKAASHPPDLACVVDGKALQVLLRPANKEELLKLGMQCKARQHIPSAISPLVSGHAGRSSLLGQVVLGSCCFCGLQGAAAALLQLHVRVAGATIISTLLTHWLRVARRAPPGRGVLPRLAAAEGTSDAAGARRRWPGHPRHRRRRERRQHGPSTRPHRRNGSVLGFSLVLGVHPLSDLGVRNLRRPYAA